jgi:cysteine-S-conjugate beta-lyase
LRFVAENLYPPFMRYNFDEIIDRRDTDSIKWGIYPHDVIPLWVADMDFQSADPIIQALKRRIDHGVFGYSRPSQELVTALRNRLQRLYAWNISEQAVLFLPGIVTGINIALQAFADRGEGVLAQPPVYFHFLRDPLHHGRILQDPPLVNNGDSYEIDFDLFERAITGNTRVFILCNPHNPVGRVYTKVELETIAEICLRHRLIICSDEIHCDLVYPPYHHIPIATLSPDVAARTITLMAPSKTYNIAGLDCGYAIIEDVGLRRQWRDFSYGIIPGVNIMGHTAALAALNEGQEWLEQVLKYLQVNRDFLVKFVHEQMPDIRISRMEATYLAWLDCSGMNVKRPSDYFLKKACVALSDGEDFGKGGTNFIRLNFACPRKKLLQALEQMKESLKSL